MRDDDDWTETKTPPPSKPGYYIWCPKDVIKTKDGPKQNSVGCSMHINRCLFNGCMCSDLLERTEELN